MDKYLLTKCTGHDTEITEWALLDFLSRLSFCFLSFPRYSVRVLIKSANIAYAKRIKRSALGYLHLTPSFVTHKLLPIAVALPNLLANQIAACSMVLSRVNRWYCVRQMSGYEGEQTDRPSNDLIIHIYILYDIYARSLHRSALGIPFIHHC